MFHPTYFLHFLSVELKWVKVISMESLKKSILVCNKQLRICSTLQETQSDTQSEPCFLSHAFHSGFFLNQWQSIAITPHTTRYSISESQMSPVSSVFISLNNWQAKLTKLETLTFLSYAWQAKNFCFRRETKEPCTQPFIFYCLSVW